MPKRFFQLTQKLVVANQVAPAKGATPLMQAVSVDCSRRGSLNQDTSRTYGDRFGEEKEQMVGLLE